jgi:hypothetical protein
MILNLGGMAKIKLIEKAFNGNREIAACPFCGTIPSGIEKGVIAYYIQCKECQIILCKDTIEDTIQTWNSRITRIDI